MRSTKHLALATTAALVALIVGTGPADATDPTYPTGSFSIPHPVQYILDNRYSDNGEGASVTISRLSLSDDATPAQDIIVRLYSGTDVANSTNGTVWDYTSDPSTVLYYGNALYDDPDVGYRLGGTYQPDVTLTDGAGHTTRIDLPTVTLKYDNTAPVARLTLPRPSRRHRTSAWHYVRGTTVDFGINAPGSAYPPYTGLSIMQKRHGWFYFYEKGRWHRGLATEAATDRRFAPDVAAIHVSPTRWRSPYIHGLTRGRLVVRVNTADDEPNWASQVLARYTLTRR